MDFSQGLFDSISLGLHVYRDCIDNFISEIQSIRQSHHLTFWAPIVFWTTFFPWVLTQLLIYGPSLFTMSSGCKAVRQAPIIHEYLVIFFNGRNGNVPDSMSAYYKPEDFTLKLLKEMLEYANKKYHITPPFHVVVGFAAVGLYNINMLIPVLIAATGVWYGQSRFVGYSNRNIIPVWQIPLKESQSEEIQLVVEYVSTKIPFT